MYNSIVQHIAHHFERQVICAASASLGRKWSVCSISSIARSTSYEPNFIQNESGANVLSVADGDDEDLMGSGSFQLGHAPSSLSLEDHVFKWHGETWVQFIEQPKGTKYMERFQYYNKDFFTVLNT